MFKFIKKQKAKKGFTLVELIVVMGVLAILVTLGAPKFTGFIEQAKDTAVAADIKVIETAGIQYSMTGENDGTVFPITGTVTHEIPAVAESGTEGTEGYISASDAVDFFAIDGDAVAPFIRTLSNDLALYVMDVEGNVALASELTAK